MTYLPEDPVTSAGGLRAAGELLRAGALTSEQMTRDYLARIDALDSELEAYEHVAHEQALETAMLVVRKSGALSRA